MPLISKFMWGWKFSLYIWIWKAFSLVSSYRRRPCSLSPESSCLLACKSESGCILVQTKLVTVTLLTVTKTAYSNTYGFSKMIGWIMNYLCSQWELVRATLFQYPKGVTVTNQLSPYNALLGNGVVCCGIDEVWKDGQRDFRFPFALVHVNSDIT